MDARRSSPSADQNLLFGILALQMDFIDRDQLISAMNRWALDKTRPLGEILVEAHDLAVDEQQLLSALVCKHLEKHGGDAARSLAVVSSVATSVRDDLQRLGDKDIEASFMRVAASRPDRDEDSLTTTLTFGAPTSDGLRFRVLRPHAKGGLGEVFVARDQELNREVALKQIQRDHADDPDSRSRFVIEAEITGGLEHPGVVPVYGLGQYADGRPFYAMRFVRGDSLKEAIARFHKQFSDGRNAAERGLQLRKLLGRFIDVCDAVAYAHSRGVLHRDLKPGNVMLGKYGETLVVDWGLAKAMGHSEHGPRSEEPTLNPASGDSSSPTQMGATIGTPSYMSPEQAAGRLDLLGPASDVYSLGATLYCLLTGQSPLPDGDVASVLQKVQRGEFPRPREVQSRVPAALESICLKAMANQPKDRYASPSALAADIEHWLADEPVPVHRDPPLAQAARWARRHKTPVAAGLGLLVTAIVGLSIGAILLTGANARIRAAHRLAQKNEAMANENFRLARQAVDDYLTTVSQETLLDEPGMQPLRQKLLDQALQYYQRFIEQHGDDPQLQLELRDAYFLVGTITRQVGSYSRALEAFQKSLEINRRLVDESRSDIQLQFKLARCLYSLGLMHSDAGRYDEALESCDEARRLLEEVAGQTPDDLELLHMLATVHNQIGSIKSDQGARNEAITAYERSLEIDRKLMEADTDPADAAEYRNSLGRTYHNLALVYHETGRQMEAIDQFRMAIDIREQLIQEFPRDSLYQFKLSLSYNSLANSLDDLGRYGESAEFHQKTIDLRERLVRENPAVTEYRDVLAGSYSNLASLYREMGRLGESADLSLKAIAVQQQLADEHPEVIDHRSNLATSFYNLGNMFHSTDRNRALAHYRSAIDIRKLLVAEAPDAPEHRADLANAYNNCASVLDGLGDGEAAVEMYGAARALRERLVAEQPDVPDYRSELASTYLNLAQADAFAGTGAERIELLRRAAELREGVVAEFPAVVHYRSKLALTYRALGIQQAMSDQVDAALESFARAVELRGQLAEAHPDNPTLQLELCECYAAQAAIQAAGGQPDAALETYHRALTRLTRLVDEQAEDRPYREALASVHHDLARLHARQGSIADALAAAKAAAELRGQLAGQSSGDGRPQLALAKSLQVLAAIQRLAGDKPGAAETDQKILALFEQLFANDAGNPRYAVGLADGLLGTARMLADRGEPEPALEQYVRALELLRPVIESNPRDTDALWSLRSALRRRADVYEQLQRFPEALADIVELGGLAGTDPLSTGVQAARLRVLTGDHAAGTAAVEQLLQNIDPSSSGEFYNAACTFALAVRAAAEDNALPEDERRKLVELYSRRTRALLAAAKQAGFFKDARNVAHLGSDTDFDSLRDTPEFQQFVGQLTPPPQP